MANLSEGSNITVWEYLEMNLGPQNMPISIVLPITVVYLLIFVSGCIGNAIVCAVIARNSHFQTPTDYYLFSLAISDLLILVFGLPNDLKVYWQQYPWGLGEAVCKFRAFIAEMTSYASVLTIVAFTIERYIAICHPLFIQTVSTLPRAIKFITSVWIVSCVCALPLAYYTRINYIDYPQGSGHHVEESAFCGLPMEIQHITRPLLQAATFAFFLFPLTVILILYVKISIKLRSTKFARMTYTCSSRCSSVASAYSPEVRKTTIRRSVNKMLIAVVIAFFICWAPFHAQRLLAVYVAPDDWTIALRITNEVLYYTAGCFYYFSATINPILYTSMSSKYRGAILNILSCFSSSRKNSTASSLFRANNGASEVIHTEKELSVRISKQSFEADSSLQVTRKVKNSMNSGKKYLSIPENFSCAPTCDSFGHNESFREKSFVRISPEGKLADALEDENNHVRPEDSTDSKFLSYASKNNRQVPICDNIDQRDGLLEKSLVRTFPKDELTDTLEEEKDHCRQKGSKDSKESLLAASKINHYVPTCDGSRQNHDTNEKATRRIFREGLHTNNEKEAEAEFTVSHESTSTKAPSNMRTDCYDCKKQHKAKTTEPGEFETVLHSRNLIRNDKETHEGEFTELDGTASKIMFLTKSDCQNIGEKHVGKEKTTNLPPKHSPEKKAIVVNLKGGKCQNLVNGVQSQLHQEHSNLCSDALSHKLPPTETMV